MGYRYELWCLYGATDLVLYRNGKAQRWVPRRPARQWSSIYRSNASSYGKLSGTIASGGDERAFQPWPFPFPDQNEPQSRACGELGIWGSLPGYQRGGHAWGCCDADDLAGSTDDLLRRWGRSLWIYWSGQPQDLSVGRGKSRPDHISQRNDPYPQSMSCADTWLPEIPGAET